MTTTVFPTSLDTFTDPLDPGAGQYVWLDGTIRDAISPPGNILVSANPALVHETQHTLINDAVAALEAKVGIDSSAVTSSLDYKIRNTLKIGNAVTSGTANSVLYVDGSGNLADSANFQYSGGTLNLTAASISTVGQIIKLQSGHTADGFQVQNYLGGRVMGIMPDGSITQRSNVVGSNGYIQLLTGANPTINISGDTTNGYYPSVSFYSVGTLSGAIQGYGNNLYFYPGTNGTCAFTQPTVNSSALTLHMSYLGAPATYLCSFTGPQGVLTGGIDSGGGLQQIGAGAQITYPVSVPVIASVTASGSGSALAAGTYYYKVTASNFLNETIGSNEVSVTITAGQNVTISWAGSRSSDGGVDHYIVYRATSAGGYTGTSCISTGPIHLPYYLTSLVDTGQAATTGSPATSLNFVSKTQRRWAGNVGALYRFEDESANPLNVIDYTGSVVIGAASAINPANFGGKSVEISSSGGSALVLRTSDRNYFLFSNNFTGVSDFGVYDDTAGAYRIFLQGATGYLGINIASAAAAQLHVLARTTSSIGLIVDTQSGPSVHTAEFKINGTAQSGVDKAGNIATFVAGIGYTVKEGSNARMGTGTLVGGTVTIANTSVTANSRIFVTDSSGSVTNLGSLTTSKSAGTSFTVTSTNILDASTFAWIIFEPA